jgi:hypothetical protein
MTFLNNHREAIAAMDFFTVPRRCCMDRAKVELSLFPADLRSDV